MKILAFETSCDDTSIALFEDDRLVSMHTKSQIKIHNTTGGVVPEVAAREHANAIFDVLQDVLNDGNISIEDIDYIGVTTHPGLLPSLLTGTTVASTLSMIHKIPILAIDHIQAHIFANFLEREEKEIVFPAVCLTVSGGHNDIYYMSGMWGLEKLWSSQDDAGGEAFDKVAKMMWLGYPGGPIISKLAAQYSCPPPARGELEGGLFPRVWLVKKENNFSFSGLKSAVKREVDLRREKKWELSDDDKKEISYEFEQAVTEVLAYKLIQSAKQKWVDHVMLAWGVSANTTLRDTISDMAQKNQMRFTHPTKLKYCMDNAAMIGILTYYRVKYGEFEERYWVVKL